MNQQTLNNTHLLKDSCREFKVIYAKLGASKFRLNKKGKVIDYDAGQNKCFWHQDNIWGEVSNITNFIKFEYQ